MLRIHSTVSRLRDGSPSYCRWAGAMFAEGTGQPRSRWRTSARAKQLCDATERVTPRRGATAARHATATVRQLPLPARWLWNARRAATDDGKLLMLALLRRKWVTHVGCHHQFLGRPTRHLSFPPKCRLVDTSSSAFDQSVAQLRLERTTSK